MIREYIYNQNWKFKSTFIQMANCCEKENALKNEISYSESVSGGLISPLDTLKVTPYIPADLFSHSDNALFSYSDN